MSTLKSLLLVSTFAALLALTVSAAAQVGSGNTYPADPPVPHPSTTPCIVHLFQGQHFADFNAKSFSYTPPASCPGPWRRVILQATFTVTKGIQYDRTANIWLGATNIYFGTTAEPTPTLAPHWRIQRDLTDYSSIFMTAQTGTANIGNLVNSQYTGVIIGSASLYFYPAAKGQTVPVTADSVIPFSSGPTGGTVTIPDGTTLLSQTLTLPTNIQSAYLDVFAQSQYNDEFWYTCVPNDVASELFSCGGTAFRESEITIDGTPAGVAPVYPWIYTGGIDPYLWAPIPGVQTLNFTPYRVNLTPFASKLDDGQPHTIAIGIFNSNNYFSVTGSLLLYLDHGSTQVTGAVTTNTLAAPKPSVVEHITTGANGNVSGSVNTRAVHQFEINGYVNTSAGRVATNLTQRVTFSNYQVFKVTSNFYQQNITQSTTINTTTTTSAPKNFTETVETNTWPLTANISEDLNSDGSFSLTTAINQSYQDNLKTTQNGAVIYTSSLSNTVAPTDTLEFDSSGNLVGNTGQSSSQEYLSKNSSGYCYSRNTTAVANILTSITNGSGCAK